MCTDDFIREVTREVFSRLGNTITLDMVNIYSSLIY